MGTERNSNFFVKLATYFQNQADQLETARNSTKIYENPGDKVQRGKIHSLTFYRTIYLLDAT